MPEDQHHLRDVPEPGHPPKIDGVNVVGYLTGEMGLGEVARQYTAALQAVGVPVATKTFTHFGNRSRHEFVELQSPKDYPVNLICLQPLELIQLYREVGEDFFKDRRSIGVWGWEMNVFPEKWLDALELLDEVWVWTNYVAETLSRISSRPVITIPIPVTAPDPGDATVDLGVPEGFTFLFVFDFHSVVNRKNPLGLIEAFKRAFAPGEGPHLIVKSINGDAHPQRLEELEVAARDRPDIHVVDRYLSGREKNALMASCDCYVSLHRSEGFGLTPAEAMALGKPVIATGFSGNTDFMTNSTSYLVDYTMTEVGPGSPPYPAEGLWAEPNLDHAAQLMHQVWKNQDEARACGERARRDIERNLSHKAVGKMMRARLERLTASPSVSTQSGRSRLMSIDANYGKSLQTIREMLEHGPHVEASSKFGRPGQLARQVMLRGIRPFTFYQGQVDERLVSALDGMAQAIGALKHQVREQRRQQREQLNQLDTKVFQKVDQIQAHLGALERNATEEMHRLGAELSGITSGLQARQDISHPLLSYTDESGKMILGFQNAEDGPSEGEAYRALEDIFRGDEQVVKTRQAWYAGLVADRPWILNVGCGRGEFLDLLRDRGTKGRGVDSNEAMISHCRDKGHDVTLSDANTYLREQDDGSIPAIFAAQAVVEHLSYEELLEFLHLVNAKLEAEGLLIFEAVNYHSLEALKTFWVDPASQHPIFPEVALTLCRLAGFRSGRILFPNGAKNLKKELFSARDYAVLATKAASDPVTEQERARRDALHQKSKSSNLRLCKVCDLPDWEDEEFRTLLDELEFQTYLDELGYSWAEDRKHRKGWEWAKGIQGLERLGALTPEAVAIGVGAGHETPLYYLANRIRKVHATDIYGSGAFAEGEGSGEMLTNPEKFAPFFYRKDHLVVKHMDGLDLKYPDGSFDIAFSFSSIEHFGGHEAASEAMREIARVLHPGGIAVITTEVILNDTPDREFFLPDELYKYLVEPSGLELVEDIDFMISPSLLEKPIDLSTDYKDVFPHIVLQRHSVAFTSVIMFLQKPTRT